jgi:hypothetical protein
MTSAADGGMELPPWPDPDSDHVLPWRQQKILETIKEFAQRRGYAPTLQQIGAAAGQARERGQLSPRSSVTVLDRLLRR